MARQIRTLIELTEKQTREFIASLGDRSNERNRRAAIRRAKAAKFNVVL